MISINLISLVSNEWRQKMTSLAYDVIRINVCLIIQDPVSGDMHRTSQSVFQFSKMAGIVAAHAQEKVRHVLSLQ